MKGGHGGQKKKRKEKEAGGQQGREPGFVKGIGSETFGLLFFHLPHFTYKIVEILLPMQNPPLHSQNCLIPRESCQFPQVPPPRCQCCRPMFWTWREAKK